MTFAPTYDCMGVRWLADGEAIHAVIWHYLDSNPVRIASVTACGQPTKQGQRPIPTSGKGHCEDCLRAIAFASWEDIP